jgi:hypothetical protein
MYIGWRKNIFAVIWEAAVAKSVREGSASASSMSALRISRKTVSSITPTLGAPNLRVVLAALMRYQSHV